jgi:hypothetical protein
LFGCIYFTRLIASVLNHRSALIWIALACVFVGCSSAKKGPVCHPVHGKVTAKGKPLAEAVVVLHRIGGDVEGNQKPMAVAKADGTFELTTFHSGDGAPPGEYAITVELRALQAGGEEPVRSGPNTLPPKFSKPETSRLKYTVVEGENQIPPIDIN